MTFLWTHKFGDMRNTETWFLATDINQVNIERLSCDKKKIEIFFKSDHASIAWEIPIESDYDKRLLDRLTGLEK